MNFIGDFREGEIDGKPFHIFTYLPQTDIPTTDSGGGEANPSLLQPLFLCPKTRHIIDNIMKGQSDDLLFSAPPQFPNRSSSDPIIQYYFERQYTFKCTLPLILKDEDEFNFKCAECSNSKTKNSSYYFCPSCSYDFHKECVESPLEITLPSYPFFSLQLYKSAIGIDKRCMTCDESIYDEICYHCPTYNVTMHPVCAMRPISIVLDHPKRHPHSLTIFPKQDLLPCSVCGLIKELIPTYVCVRCVFVVHQDCIYFPYVIRISRHHHRISFVSRLPSGKWSCGVCRKKVNNNCGAYSCNKCPDYFVHSRCALRKDLWDGKELEGVDEEPEIVVEPFVTIADGIILHFSHGHHLKLEISGDYDDDKFCQACVLPIYEGKYYSCMDQCDFILHERCASSPLKMYNPLHCRPVMLEVVTDGYNNGDGRFRCSACRRQSCGYVYEDSSTYTEGFRLDVRCASVSEPFKYEGHPHPLFLALTPEEEESAVCQICQDTGSTIYCCRKLNCIECDFIICYKCATLPYKAMYKHDKHFLTFRKAKEASDESSWCEVCERKIEYSGKGGYYTCDEYCCTTLHVDCLLGPDPYMKPGRTVEICSKKFYVHRKSTMSWPRCFGSKCGKERVPYKVIFKVWNGNRMGRFLFCSYGCALSTLEDLEYRYYSHEASKLSNPYK